MQESYMKKFNEEKSMSEILAEMKSGTKASRPQGDLIRKKNILN